MSNTTVVEVETMLRRANRWRSWWAGDRHHHIETEIMPASAAGEVALIDRVPAFQSGSPAHGRAGLGHDLEPQRRHVPPSGRVATGRGRLVDDQFDLAMKWGDMIRLHTVPRVLAADR
jgi:hypothetical protein